MSRPTSGRRKYQKDKYGVPVLAGPDRPPPMILPVPLPAPTHPVRPPTLDLITVGQGVIPSYISSDMEKIIQIPLTCVKNTTKWNIQTSTAPLGYDNDVFPIDSLKTYNDYIDSFYNTVGKDIHNENCTPLAYLKNVTIDVLSKSNRAEIANLWRRYGIVEKDSSGKIFKSILSYIGQSESILSYPFESSLSIHMFTALDTLLRPSEENTYMVLSNNAYYLDGILYYQKFHKLEYSTGNITFYQYAYKYTPTEATKNYITTRNIRQIDITVPMNNRWIDQQETSPIDYAVVDLIIGVREIDHIRETFTFQTTLSGIILSLKRLATNGVMIVNTGLIPNKMVYNFYVYLSCFFNKTYGFDLADGELYPSSQLISVFCIFEGYRGGIDMDKLLELNEQMYDLDPTGGYMYNPDDNTKRTFAINYNPPSSPKGYITNIIDIADRTISQQYARYREYAQMKFLAAQRNFAQRYNNITRKDEAEYMKNQCSIAKTRAIFLAQKYNLPLLDWVKQPIDEYFNTILSTRLVDLDYTSIKQFPSTTAQIGKYDGIGINHDLIELVKISEQAYQYIEKIDYDAYKEVELFINKKYKVLNKKLLDEYGININGKYVSRAWIKFYELLSDTKLLAPFKVRPAVKILHICEAPGNFINSMDIFMKKHMPSTTYQWNAQSLSAEQADFFDSYGFIRQTRNKWDLGPKGTGDILDYDNLKYYYDKYHDVDFLISDCGEKWSGEEKNINRDISVFQLIYALLVPKYGFVIKTFSVNISNVFLAYLYIICSKYDSVRAFKSNTNFWSPEIYIIGEGKKELTADEIKIIFENARTLATGRTVYPIREIPADFAEKYKNIMMNFTIQAADIKKFFVFLSTNQEFFNQKRNQLSDIISEKNNGWVKKYLGPAREATSTTAVPVAALSPRVVSRPGLPYRTLGDVFQKFGIGNVSLGGVFQRLLINDLRPQAPNSVTIKGKAINIDRLGSLKDDFRPAYIPTLRSLPSDDPLKQKIGGHRPFFLQGDHWPTTKDINPYVEESEAVPLVFITQFVDPRRGKNQLVQLFFPDITDENFEGRENVYLRKLDLTLPFTRQEIPEPLNTIKNQNVYDEPREITSWNVRDELDSQALYGLIDEAGLSDLDYNDVYNDVYEAITPMGLYPDIKIGGWGETNQGGGYDLFIQNIYNGYWGDDGVLHVDENGEAFGDMS